MDSVAKEAMLPEVPRSTELIGERSRREHGEMVHLVLNATASSSAYPARTALCPRKLTSRRGRHREITRELLKQLPQ